jgi:hypothetical protein
MQRTRSRALPAAGIAFVAANVAHTLDHLRQGTSGLSTEILAGGSVLSMLAVATLVFVWRRDRRAPLIAAVVGLSSAAGVAASHIAPHWSVFSDSYPEIHADALSWVVMLAEVVAALALGLVGLWQLQDPRSRLSSSISRWAALRRAGGSSQSVK